MANDRHNFKNHQQQQNADKKIIIAERDNIAAVMEGGKVTDFFISRGDVILGDVYLATVDNILPSIDAAFVDVGVDKMGFLHAQDVMGKGSLKDKLSPKQKLIVQVVKEPTGHKGPRVTTEISLPGRFLVLMPNEPGISISKKINSKLLSFWGRNTLIIMATHQLILTMFSKINIVNELSFTTKLILVLVIEYPIIVLINNYTPFLLGKLKKKYKLNKETIQEI